MSALFGARIALPSQARGEGWVGCHGLGVVDSYREASIVANWTHPEFLANQVFFSPNRPRRVLFKLDELKVSELFDNAVLSIAFHRSLLAGDVFFPAPNVLTLYYMTVRPIVIHGDPVLHNPTEPVTESPEELAELIADMYETMDVANGVGLAANQIGVNKRIFVYNCPDTDGPNRTPLPEDQRVVRRGCVINPVLETSEIPKTMPNDDGTDEEGCLSVPGEGFPTGRADWAKVTGIDEHGNPVAVEGYGFFARCLQHEVGHLDGFLYTDTLIGRWKRAAKRAIKANGWNEPGLTWMPGVDPDPFGHDVEGA